MSRRTQLIILGIFAVLLGIGVYHTARTWTVQEPLRFRLVDRSGPTTVATAFGSYEEMRYVFEVTNVTDVPVELCAMGIDSRQLPELPDMIYEVEGSGRLLSTTHLSSLGEVIHAHRTVRVTRRIPGPHVVFTPALQIEAGCRYQTVTRGQVRRLVHWLEQPLPETWRPRLRFLTPEGMHVPLEFSPTLPPHVVTRTKPRHPLLFRIGIAERGARDAETTRKARVLVRNISDAPVHLHDAVMTRDAKQFGLIHPKVWLGSSGYDEVIPAGATVEMAATLFPGTSDNPSAKALQVEYAWMSESNYNARDMASRFRDMMPHVLHHALFRIPASQSTVSLETAHSFPPASP